MELTCVVLPHSTVTPTLTLDKASPTDGEVVVLTCATPTTGIDTYQFLKDGVSVVDSSSATYTMPTATIDTDDGRYTCVAKKNTVASEPSKATIVACTF